MATDLPRSGLTAANLLRRAGIRLGWYDVRDLLFYLPRRYDDLRELSHLGDLVWTMEGTVVSARVRVDDIRVEGSWRAAFALFGYAAAFSFAYLSLPAGTGALLLFGAVQATMVATGLARGEGLARLQWLGFALALSGLVALVAPGVSAPPLAGACLMLAAGVAWGAYSLFGRGVADPLAATAGNFLRALPMALALLAAVAAAFGSKASLPGLAYAALSGAVASGLGYTVWYAALRGLTAAQGASVQLSVPVVTAVVGGLVLGEAVTLRLAASSLAILGGIALVIGSGKKAG